MKTISKVLSEDKQLQGTTAGKVGNPAAKKETPLEKRIKPEKLEQVYRSVPVVFNSINKTTQMITSRDRELQGPNSEFFQEFLSNVGEVGGNQHWEEILESVFRFQMIYGEAFVELIRDKNSGEVVDLAIMDPKSMDYAKSDRMGDKVAMDEFNNPIGYVQKLPRRFGGIDQVYEAPEEVTLQPNEVYFPAENIAHFKLYTVGEEFFPIGLVEPIFRDAERSHQLKEDYGNKAHSELFPTRVAKVGDETHEPSPQKVNEILDNLLDAGSSTAMAVPYYVDIEVVEAEQPEVLIDFFEHFNNEIITGTGIPAAYATGQGGNVNRATLAAQSRMYEITMDDIIKRTTRTIERQIFKRIAESNDLEGFPEMVWSDDQVLTIKGYGEKGRGDTDDSSVDDDEEISDGSATRGSQKGSENSVSSGSVTGDPSRAMNLYEKADEELSEEEKKILGMQGGELNIR